MKRSDYQSLKQAKSYEEKRFAKGLRIISQDEMEVIKDLLSNTKPESIIDIGTGTGRMLKAILRMSPKVLFALDPSVTMLSIVNKKYKKEITRDAIKIIEARSDKIPLPDKTIDVATSFHVLKHLRNINPTIREVNRILKPNGYFIFDILNKNSLIRFNLGTCFALTEKSVKKELEAKGFKIKEIQYIHSLGETIYNIPYGKHSIYFIDKLLSFIFPRSGTKIFVLAQKNE